MVRYILLCAILLCANVVVGMPDGAPCSTYDDMHPSPSSHGPENNKPAPYEVLFLDDSSKETSCYSPGKNYIVRVRPKSSSDTFRGFLIQCRDSNDKPTGKFDVSGDAKLQCSNENSVTHTASDTKSKVDARWKSETDKGSIVCKASVVEELNTYWVKIPSKTISTC